MDTFTSFKETNTSVVSVEEKLNKIEGYIKLNIENKKNYFLNSKQDIKIIEDGLEKLNRNETFSQANFKNLIERFKISLSVNIKNKQYYYYYYNHFQFLFLKIE